MSLDAVIHRALIHFSGLPSVTASGCEQDAVVQEWEPSASVALAFDHQRVFDDQPSQMRQQDLQELTMRHS